MRFVRSIFPLLVLLAINFGATTANRADVFVDGDVYFIDADCYSRMTRVQRVLEHPFTRIDHHEFENYPAGTNPHTTAPFDYLIAGLSVILSPFTTNAVDLAGAWISPLLSFALLTYLWIWAVRENLPYRLPTLLILAASPIVVQAFEIGRPDHQSLTLALLTAGVAAEITLRRTRTRPWAIAWGLLWGAALWVTLFEPLIILTLVLLTRLIPNRKSKIETRKSRLLAAAIAASVVALAILLDGWRLGPLPPEVAEYFPRWSTLLGELRPVPFFSTIWFQWFGYLLPAVPLLILWGTSRSGGFQPPKFGLTLLAIVLATYALTLWQIRWAPFFITFTALLLPTALAAIPSRLAATTLFTLSLLPILSAWDAKLYPDAATQAARDEQRTENILLRQTATALISNETTPILAPWWLCPAIAYWSGQPCVGGSSHQSLPGIVDTARFYLATTPTEALAILARRQVRYVIAYEPDRLITTSAVLLAKKPTRDAIATALFDRPQTLQDFEVVHANPYFRILTRTIP
jgi:hypothetical protein